MDGNTEREHRRSRSRERHRSRSRERKNQQRSKSRSKSPEGFDPSKERRRPTWFDIPPVGGAPPPMSQLPGAVHVIPDNASSSVAVASHAGGANQQATRHARRIYVGGLPPSAGEDNIATFFSNALAAVGGTTAGPGACVMNVYINQEKKFAFVELRTVEEASNAMALDGIMFEGVTVRIRRPADYNPAAAAPLGPSEPNPNLNLAAIGMDKSHDQAQIAGNVPQVAGTHDHDPDRVFVGGLPYYLSDAECRELLGTFGAIRNFDLIRDRNTGDSKGYGFVIYEDPAVIDAAITGLHGMRLGDRTLTVRRADGPKNIQPVQPPMAKAEGGYQAAMFTASAPKVVKLKDAITIEELEDDEEYEDILEDMREEFGKFGKLVALHIPRPPKDDSTPPAGLGKIIVEFSEPNEALVARNKLHGRKFGGRPVEATLMTEEDYKGGKWD